MGSYLDKRHAFLNDCSELLSNLKKNLTDTGKLLDPVMFQFPFFKECIPLLPSDESSAVSAHWLNVTSGSAGPPATHPTLTESLQHHQDQVIVLTASFCHIKSKWGNKMAWCEKLGKYTVHWDDAAMLQIQPATNAYFPPLWFKQRIKNTHVSISLSITRTFTPSYST